VGHVQSGPCKLGQHHIPGHRCIFGDPGNSFESQLSGDKALVHHPFADQRNVFGVGDDCQAKGARIFEGPSHQFAIGHRPAVVGNRQATSLFQLTHLGQRLTFQPLGDAADRIDVDTPLFGGLAPDVEGDRLVVVDRVGVGHAGHRSKAAGCGRPGAGHDVFLVLVAGIAQVHVYIDQPGNHQLSPGVDHLCLASFDIFANIGDLAVLDKEIEGVIDVMDRIQHPPAFDQYFHSQTPKKRVCSFFSLQPVRPRQPDRAAPCVRRRRFPPAPG
jgi:hypothetical protein